MSSWIVKLVSAHWWLEIRRKRRFFPFAALSNSTRTRPPKQSSMRNHFCRCIDLGFFGFSFWYRLDRRVFGYRWWKTRGLWGHIEFKDDVIDDWSFWSEFTVVSRRSMCWVSRREFATVALLLYLRHPQSLGIADNRCLIYITKEEKYVPSFWN